jgi:hypothetical protein
MLEMQVEGHLKRLESFGFEVLKLKTPGYSGTKDRLILWPKWSPAPPVFVEIKRPGKNERALQAAVRDDWRARGCDVRPMCDTIEKVQALCDYLLLEAVVRGKVRYATIPPHIIKAAEDARRRLR